MLNVDKNGIYLYQKNGKDLLVLKDLIKLLRLNFPKTCLHFYYVESKSSLHQELTLWENLQLVTGTRNWREFCQTIPQEISGLLKNINNCHIKTSTATPLEQLIIGLIQAFYEKDNILIDINEDDLTTDIIIELKKLFLNQNLKKNFFLATANPGLWIDCAQSLIKKNTDQTFEKIDLNPEKSKITLVA